MDLPSGPTEFNYAFKASLLGAPLEYRLADDALEWRRGASAGRAAYGHIRRIRLSFRPMTMQNYRFLAEVWPADASKLQIASTSWKSVFEHQRLDAEYRAFVVELNRRVGAARGNTSFVTGSPVFIYWPGVAVFIGAAFGVAALAVRALQVEAFAAAAFIAAFFALFMWQAGNFFLRNRPGVYAPDAVPPRLLPKT
jgi:hypothetical protein